MSTRAASDPTLSRPAFRDGARLRASDLECEAEANVQTAARHQTLAHTVGIVAGLTVNWGNTTVTPGMAIDGLGRSVFVSAETRFAQVSDLQQEPQELWLAYREEKPTEPVSHEGELLLEPPGRYDPAKPAAHPRHAVYLGRSGVPTVQDTTRVYVGAVGARIEAASRQTRLLLGPDNATDVRVFAVSTREAQGEYRDTIAVENDGTIRFHDPVVVKTSGKRAVLAVACRAVAFQPHEILDVEALQSKLPEFFAQFKNTFTATARCARLRSLLATSLNSLIANAFVDRGEKLYAAAIRSRETLRPETVRQCQSHAGRSPRMDTALYARLLLEDTFPTELARLSFASRVARGLVFVGSRADTTEPLPSRLYLATVTEKKRQRRELRIEIQHPGKENNPERYSANFGIVGAVPGNPKGIFDAALKVDASGVVTISGLLRVLSEDQSDSERGRGLILVSKPTPKPGEVSASTNGFGTVAPWDLAFQNVIAKRSTTTPDKFVEIEATIQNTGLAPITAVQVHAVVYAKQEPTQLPEKYPIRETLLRDLTAEPDKPVKLETSDKQMFRIKIESLPAAPAALVLVLMVVGLGPGNVIASSEQRVQF